MVATKSNAQAFGYFDNIKAIKLDLVQNYFVEKSGSKKSIESENSKEVASHNKYSELLTENKMDTSFDMIVCNPPWINASFVFTQTDLENAVYDPEHKFLRSAFNFAKIHLNRNNPEARFVLIFSDIGSILNVNDTDIVEKLAVENKLIITNKKSKPSELKTTDNNDPLKNFKKEAKILLYEFKRI